MALQDPLVKQALVSQTTRPLDWNTLAIVAQGASMGKSMPGTKPIKDLKVELDLLHDLEQAADALERAALHVENRHQLHGEMLYHAMTLRQAHAAAASFVAKLSRDVLAARLDGAPTEQSDRGKTDDLVSALSQARGGRP